MDKNKKLSTKEKFAYLFKNKYFWLATAFLLFSILTSLLAANYLENKYGNNLPILHDLILDNIPSLKIAWLYDLLAIFMYFILAIYAFKNKVEDIPYFILLLGIFHFIRSIFIILTPLGVPNGGGQGLLKDPTAFQGEYPSGHAADAFSIFLFTKGAFKKIALGVVILMTILLLFGKGHYSIDIFSAMIFSYAIYALGEKFIKKRFRLKK